MAVEFHCLQNLYDGKSEAPAGFVADAMSLNVIYRAMAQATNTSSVWNKLVDTGSCRAAAHDPAYQRHGVGGGTVLVATSVFGQTHAEETLVPAMTKLRTGAFTLMYVDMVPCHEGRYRGHDCLMLIVRSFNMGRVYYWSTQEGYVSGDNKSYKSAMAPEQFSAVINHIAQKAGVNPSGVGFLL